MKGIYEKSSPQACQAFENAVQGRESTQEYLHRRLMVFLREIARRYRRTVKPLSESKGVTVSASAAESIRKGDLVQVRSLDEIRRTLDHRGYTKGCKFMKQMEQFCEQSHRVVGSIEKFFDEARCRTLNCKNLVLLDQVFCDGSVVGGCDRMCFLFWRTEWLKKLD